MKLPFFIEKNWLIPTFLKNLSTLEYTVATNNLSLATIDITTQLVERCRSNDSAAQFELYKRYSKAMYNISLRMLGNSDDAQDVLQDAFVAAFQNLQQFTGKATFGAWLKRIVINRCLDFLKKKRLPIVEIENISYKISEKPVEKEKEFTLYGIHPKQVHNEIKNLPKGCRVILNLYLLEGYDHKEIAQILEISESTSKSQYARAKKLLKERLLH